MTDPTQSGIDVLREPLVNKGLKFSAKDRKNFKLNGLLPAMVDISGPDGVSFQERVIIQRLEHITDNLEKHDYLMRMCDLDKVHFYRLFNKHPEEIMPLVYTPTVGAACQNYAIVYHPGRGLFIPITEANHIGDILRNWPNRDVRAIVVTDGERILGLGDLGAFGMGIPVGKLALCTGLAGIPPQYCLPIVVDVGTNNTSLLEDPLYFGIRKKRYVGDVYDNFIDNFMQCCVNVFGKDVLIQFEDFGNKNAFRFLKKYATKYSCFNDDIQGTAAVILSGILTSARKTGRKLREEIIVCYGAGESMIGFASLLVETLKSRCGLSEAESLRHIFMVDSRGLIVTERCSGGITTEKSRFARPANTPQMSDLNEIIEFSKCTALIGASACAGAFTPEILKNLAKQCDKPLVFALSNPTQKSECTAETAYKATKGQCIFASGSPFPVVTLSPGDVPRNTTPFRKPGQANNAYIYPGMVLAIASTRIRPIIDEDFIIAAETLSENVTDLDLCQGCLYPPWERIRYVSYEIARQVTHRAFKDGRCYHRRCEGRSLRQEDLEGAIKSLSSYPDEIETDKANHC